MIFNEYKYTGISSNAHKPIEYEISENGCWICTSHRRHRDGYPKLRRGNRKIWVMSRYIFQIFNGVEIPDGMVVMHTCDNPPCINPKHLKIGTVQENALDCVQKGRSLTGIKNPASKITEEDAASIILDTRPYSKIAKDYGIDKGHVYHIKKGDAWKHLHTV